MKPVVFVGSSSEKSDVALAIQSNLDATADVRVWNQGIFGLSKGTLESLVEVIGDSDFAVFVLAPDDIVELRDKAYQTPRDNLAFELGLSFGLIGSERTYFVVPRKMEDLRLPSDLAGVTAATYDADRTDLEAALAPACFRISQKVKVLGLRQARFPKPELEVLRAPMILCAATRQFESIGFDDDVAVLASAFPESVEVERDLTSERLEVLLTSKRFSIVHLLCFVHPKTGEIIFSEAREGGLTVEPKRSMSAEGFFKLAEFCGVRLVVLASCDSLILAAKLARVTNLVAAADWVRVEDIVRWERSFYECLAHGQPLSTSYELATAVSQAPMLLLMKKDFT